MKTNFDKDSIARNFKPNDLLLAFLSIPMKTLQSKFHGHYVMKEKIGDVNYIIMTPERRRTVRLVHISLLKSYYSRDPNEESVLTIESVKDNKLMEDNIPVITDNKFKNSDFMSNLGVKFQHLPPEQTKELACLLQEYSLLFGDVLHQCHLVEHDVALTEGATPVKQHPYRTSPWKRQALKKEVDFLVQHGLVEKSTNEWASPCLLVDKPDGSFRMCTDYRRVNQLTRQDCYPLPRIDYLIDNLGEAAYITKID